MNYNDYHAFKEITENPIILDFSKCKYLGEIHLMLKEKFGLPNITGKTGTRFGTALTVCFMSRVIILPNYTAFIQWIKICRTNAD